MLWFALLFLLTITSQVQATVLGDAAAALSAGQWVKMLNGTGAGQMGNLNATASYPAWDNNTSDNPGVNGSAAPGPAYDGGQPGWNSATRKMYFQTTEHGRAGVPNWCPAYWPLYPHGCWKPTWTYDTDTNNWDVGRSGQTITGVFPHDNSNNPQAGVHVWGGITWDDGNQVLYVKTQEQFGIQVHRFCAPTATVSYCAGQLGAWKPLPTFSFPANELLGQALGYHRTLNGGTLLVWEQSGAGTGCAALAGYKEGTTGTNGTWTLMNSGSGCIFPTSPGAPLLEGQYSTIKQVMVLSSGTTKMWRVTNTGVIQALDDAPCAIGTTNGTFATAAEDVNTGNIWFLACDGAPRILKLDPTAGSGSQWTTVVSTATITSTGQLCEGDTACIWKIYATPIRTYGVIGFWKWKQLGLAEYWLYKPSAGGGGDITPPTVSITAPIAGTVSGNVTISANASDDVAVAGVTFKVDGNTIQTEDTTSAYSISWDSTSVANGSHAITAVARDTSNNLTTSTAVNVTVSNVGGSDFATRCAAPGVIRCVGFDNASDIANFLDGSNSALSHDGTALGVLDTTVKASGNSSLKMTIPQNSGAVSGQNWANNSGNYWINFSDDLLTVFPCHNDSYFGGTTCRQVGTGNDYYVQFRARFDPYYITHAYAGGGWKLAWVGNAGDHPGCNTSNTANCFSSCTDLEIVLQNTFYYNVGVLGYQGCPGSPYERALYVNDVPNPGDINMQSSRPAPYCLYSTWLNCFRWFSNEFMTFQAHVHVDNIRTFTGGVCAAGLTCRDYPNSYVEVWVAREGQPSELVITKTLPLFAGLNSADVRYGKVWLTAYDSNRCLIGSCPDATQDSYLWFDELIVSDRKIADPGGSVAPPTIKVSAAKRRIF